MKRNEQPSRPPASGLRRNATWLPARRARDAEARAGGPQLGRTRSRSRLASAAAAADPAGNPRPPPARRGSPPGRRGARCIAGPRCRSRRRRRRSRAPGAQELVVVGSGIGRVLRLGERFDPHPSVTPAAGPPFPRCLRPRRPSRPDVRREGFHTRPRDRRNTLCTLALPAGARRRARGGPGGAGDGAATRKRLHGSYRRVVERLVPEFKATASRSTW